MYCNQRRFQMNAYLIFAVIAVAVSGAWARPREHRSHRSHRGAECASITFRPFSPRDVVCGSDGKTYVNEGHIQFENCVRGQEVTVERQGWCDEETQALESLKDVLWEVLVALGEAFFNDIDPRVLEEFLNLIFVMSGEETSGEEILNFLIGLNDSDENATDALEEFLKVLESVGSTENVNANEIPDAEPEINDESNVIPEVLFS
ncbi:hypothetical protein L9F63_006689 [Diploptera punctata]|uniref:Kazal-like domain-containing protein n=1 Tax=Diploptera punctata TaxID=6984 RepID=A0AAD8E4G6_DIPPU|nr:hypothetical protein L9F63_006689 [Diploptera punctata]